MAYGGYGWRPYVPVWKRQAQAQKKMDALRRKGVDIQPVVIEGRKIARTFWGEAWCDHLESFSDYANRLPRGRTYVRNGSVCHLEIKQGEVLAQVCGSELYKIKIQIKTLPAKKWNEIKARCAGHIGSLLELLQGKLSEHVMQVVTDRREGLFPQPGEISLGCSCPDWAVMCKHVAAVMYGVGARLDQQPELLFRLRGVDHEELLAADAQAAVSAATSRGRSKRLAGDDLADVFGIDLEPPATDPTSEPSRKKKPVRQPKKASPAKVPKKATARSKSSSTRSTKSTKSTRSTPSTKAPRKKAAKRKIGNPA